MRHLIDPLDFTQQEISTLLDLADRIHDDPAAYQEVARHKKLATLFYEPSTRTRLSFEAAMLNLGGHVLGFPSENVSSASKGESVADTIRVVSCYADIVAMRHPKEGAPLRASRYSRIPVINAGDGGHQHPTQTLTDLMTIRRRMGRLDDLTIGLCGDLKFGRTVHSLIKTMARCKNIRFVLISPEELRVPDYIVKDVLEANGIPYQETRSLEESMSELDILYMTRVQKERFFNEEDYIRLKNSYILTKEKMSLAKPDMAVLDVMLPDMDGFILAKKIREQNPIPILFLTAKGEIDDKSKGFEAGADDYMVKPFIAQEFVWRITAILRRTYKESEESSFLLDACKVDLEQAEVYREGQEPVSLTAKEVEILKKLYANAGRIVTLGALCQTVCGDIYIGYEKTLMSHIRHIREKIEINPKEPRYLKVVWGVGYKFEVVQQ